MTTLPESELRALNRRTFDALRILELGNKKNGSGLYRDYYEALGGRYFCTDINGKDGAIAWDIRCPMPEVLVKGKPYDIVTNFGFTEHVQDRQAECWENIHNLVHPGYGQLSCVTPAPGFWKTHGKASGYPGRWYPHPVFYQEFALLNGYDIEDLWFDEQIKVVCCRLTRLPDERAFEMPSGLYDNVSNQPRFESLIWRWT